MAELDQIYVLELYDKKTGITTSELYCKCMDAAIMMMKCDLEAVWHLNANEAIKDLQSYEDAAFLDIGDKCYEIRRQPLINMDYARSKWES